jgi:hypothetical protein
LAELAEKTCMTVAFQRLSGKTESNWFWEMMTYARLMALPKSSGIGPEKLLALRSTMVRFRKDPKPRAVELVVLNSKPSQGGAVGQRCQERIDQPIGEENELKELVSKAEVLWDWTRE